LIPGTIAPEISANGGLYTINTTLRSNADLLGYGHLRIVQPSKVNSLVDLVAGTYRVGRFKFINTVAWDINSDLSCPEIG
jgi:hypothetical protein